MRIAAGPSIPVLLFALVMPAAALCSESGKEDVVSGKVGIAGKYESNFDLLSKDLPEDPEEEEKIDDAFITELSALLLFKSSLASSLGLELELHGLTNLHVPAVGDSWYVGRGNLYLGYDFDSNSISLLYEARYFSEPDDTEFDNFRNTSSIVYARVISPLWQGRAGYENILHFYPQSDFFNYYANGGFVEFRNTWMPEFSTYYSYGFHYYQGGFDSGESGNPGSPEASNRHTLETGFESFFAQDNSLSGSYTFQVDNSSGQGVNQIGEIQGEDENLEAAEEFNFIRHKGMLLFSHRFNDRFTLSLYGELIHKTFDELASEQETGDRERTDILLLSSVWFSARIYSEFYVKTRYLYRMNQSSIDLEDFEDHIISLGVEHRF